jgi:hypothetical protein
MRPTRHHSGAFLVFLVAAVVEALVLAREAASRSERWAWLVGAMALALGGMAQVDSLRELTAHSHLAKVVASAAAAALFAASAVRRPRNL